MPKPIGQPAPEGALWKPDIHGEYHLRDLMYALEETKEDKMTKNQLPAFINMEFFVAGLGHYDYEYAKDHLVEGLPVELDPEPENEYDPNAVAIRYDGWKLGFIPARTGEAKLICKALDAGRKFETEITRHKEETLVHRKVKIRVTQIELFTLTG